MKLGTGPLARNTGAAFDDGRKRLFLQVQILYDLLPSAQWVNISAAILIFGLLAKYVPMFTLITWLGLVVLIVISRMVIADRFRKAGNDIEHVQVWFNWFLIGTILYGVMWSGTAILLVPSESPAVAAITGLLLCGLTAGAVAVSSVNLEVFLVYAASAMWPYAAFLIASGQQPQGEFGYMILLFSALISIVAVRVNRSFMNLVNLQLRAIVLEEEVRRESRKREMAEKALLDNTLEEELAERIRQRTHELKSDSKKQVPVAAAAAEAPAESTENLKLRDQLYRYYLDTLNGILLQQVESAGGFVTLLRETNVSEEQQRYLGLIDKILNDAASTMKRVANEEDAIDKDFSPAVNEINIRRMLIFLTEGVPLIYKAKFITVKRHVDASIPKKLYGNESALEEILGQLLRNSLQFSDGGTVEITVEKDFEDADQMVLTFKVVDTGVGMSRELVDYLKGERDQGPVDGGLVRVRRLVRMLGGQIHAKSVPGVGSTVGFSIACFKSPSSALFDA